MINKNSILEVVIAKIIAIFLGSSFTSIAIIALFCFGTYVIGGTRIYKEALEEFGTRDSNVRIGIVQLFVLLVWIIIIVQDKM